MNTLGQILRNYSCELKFKKKYDTEFLLDSRDEIADAIYYLNNRNSVMAKKILQPYIPALRKYIDKKQIKVTLSNNQSVTIPIIIMNDFDLPQPLASCDSRFDARTLEFKYIHSINVYPSILTFPTRVIDTVLAHEIAHAMRYLEGRDKYETTSVHAEFWADRELKKYLILINPKYHNKKERLLSIKLMHQMITGRKQQAGVYSPLGQLWDRLRPFF